MDTVWKCICSAIFFSGCTVSTNVVQFPSLDVLQSDSRYLLVDTEHIVSVAATYGEEVEVAKAVGQYECERRVLNLQIELETIVDSSVESVCIYVGALTVDAISPGTFLLSGRTYLGSDGLYEIACYVHDDDVLLVLPVPRGLLGASNSKREIVHEYAVRMYDLSKLKCLCP